MHNGEDGQSAATSSADVIVVFVTHPSGAVFSEKFAPTARLDEVKRRALAHEPATLHDAPAAWRLAVNSNPRPLDDCTTRVRSVAGRPARAAAAQSASRK